MLAPIQLNNVAKATIFGCTIYGMYSKITGPSVHPKKNIKIYKHTTISIYNAWFNFPSTSKIGKYAIPKQINTVVLANVPICKSVFLPSFDNTYTADKEPNIWHKFKNICIKFPFPGITSSRIDIP